MPKFTAEQVKTLAPDPSAFSAGKGLANVRKWASLGANDAALWGECQGSGKDPYKVRIDLSDNTTSCTCPSRKFPCKHAIGLMLLAADSPAKLTESTPPAWVAEWLEKRTTRKSAAVKKAEPKADSESRQKDTARRASKRDKLADTGLEALETWLKDTLRHGLVFAQSARPAYWEEQAARLVDSKLSGAARLVREMAKLPGDDPTRRAEILLLRLSRLHLLAQAYHKLDSLPPETQADVRSLLGWTLSQDELTANTEGVNDDWLVLAQTLEEDEKTGIRSQVTWLWGKTSQKPGLILNYAHRTQPLDASLIPAQTLRGELVYFPGAAPLRAVFKTRQVVEPAFVPTGYRDFSAFLDAYASALGLNPWLEVFPVVLENVVVMKEETNWMVCDSNHASLPLSTYFASPWELFSLSGGHPLRVFGLWDGFALLPMAAWDGGRFIGF